MTRPVRVLLTAGAIVLALGIALTTWRVMAYLESGQAITSTSGLVVFRVGEELVQYAPYVATTEPVMIGLGVALLVLAVFVAALTYRSESRSAAESRSATESLSSSPSRPSIAGSNADAHTR